MLAELYRENGKGYNSDGYSLFVTVGYCKPRAVSTEQRERARHMMIERNMMKND
jgi:hypothetical protein